MVMNLERALEALHCRDTKSKLRKLSKRVHNTSHVAEAALKKEKIK